MTPESNASVNMVAAPSRAPRPIPDSEQSRHQGTHQIFTSSGTHDGVVSSRHCWSVICCDHQTHLQKLAGVRGQPSLEPKERKHSSDSHILSKHLRDRDT